MWNANIQIQIENKAHAKTPMQVQNEIIYHNMYLAMLLAWLYEQKCQFAHHFGPD